MPEQLTRRQTWWLRCWVYGVILSFVGAASFNGIMTPQTIGYKVVRFLLVFWVLFEYDRRGGMSKLMVNNLVKSIGVGFLFIAILICINEARFPKGLPHLFNGFLLSAVLAIPIGTAFAVFFTNGKMKKREAMLHEG